MIRKTTKSKITKNRKIKTTGNKTRATTRKSAPKLVKDGSVIKNGVIFCVNHTENSTPFWSGTICNNSHIMEGALVRWTCSDCVAMAMPTPAYRRQTTPTVIDPTTGEVVRRKRGRPRKNPPKPVTLDENGRPIKRGRGRPPGAKNIKTIEREKKIKDGIIVVEPKRPRGRPKGSKNKVVKTKSVSKQLRKPQRKNELHDALQFNNSSCT